MAEMETKVEAGKATATTPEKGKTSKVNKGKGSRRGRGKFDHNADKTRAGNDFSFWNEYPELMGIATRIPWMHIQGTPLVGNNVETHLSNVVVQDFLPIPGVQSVATDPINLMFRSLYLDMHRKYRGIGAYQASDIAITVLCIESALQLIVELERVYGILNYYPLKNRVAPEGLVRALGYSASFIDSVKNGMSDYRYSLNRIIDKARRLPLPAGMNFFKNHLSLNGFVYTDSKDERAAYIVFRQMGYFRYLDGQVEGSVNSAGTAKLVRFFRLEYNDYHALMALVESLITDLLEDSDILRITSDFIACYGENNMQVLLPIPEDFRVIPAYDEAILSKWHNSESNGLSMLGNGYVAISSQTTKVPVDTTANYNFVVYQEKDVIISLPTFYSASATTKQWAPLGTAGRYVIGGNAAIANPNVCNAHILDSWQPEPDQATICEAFLWKSEVTNVTTAGGTTFYARLIDICGTEMLLGMTVYQIEHSTIANYTSDITTVQTSTLLYGNSGLFQIDWHPILLHANGPKATALLGDVDNVTVTSHDVMGRIIDAALLSAYKVSISGGSAKE